MRCDESSNVMVGKIMRERCTCRSKTHETPKQCVHTLKDSYPNVKSEQGNKKERLLCTCEAQWASNGLYMKMVKRYMAN